MPTTMRRNMIYALYKYIIAWTCDERYIEQLTFGVMKDNTSIPIEQSEKLVDHLFGVMKDNIYRIVWKTGGPLVWCDEGYIPTEQSVKLVDPLFDVMKASGHSWHLSNLAKMLTSLSLKYPLLHFTHVPEICSWPLGQNAG